jgi:hypothetical protein
MDTFIPTQAGCLRPSATKNASISERKEEIDLDTANDTRGAEAKDQVQESQDEPATEPEKEPMEESSSESVTDQFHYSSHGRPQRKWVQQRYGRSSPTPAEAYADEAYSDEESSDEESSEELHENPYEPYEEPYEVPCKATDDRRSSASLTPESQKRDVVIGVRFYDTRGFYNRVVNDAGDFTIEALVGSPDATEDNRLEMARRNRIISRRHEHRNLNDGVLRSDELDHRTSDPQKLLPVSKLGTPGRISMVRIRSAAVVRAIIEFGGNPTMSLDYSLDGKLFLFPRPFTSFFYCQNDMKKRLAELRRRLEMEPEPEGPETAAPQPGEESDERALNKRAVEELRLYIEFVDSYIMPLWKQFDEVNDKTPRSISYGDIPLLFRAGELAYIRPPVEIRNNPNSGIQTVFKMVRSLRNNCRRKGNMFWSVYCLDYQDGGYTAVWRTIQFPHFDGLGIITTLPCYPLKLHPDCKRLLEHQIKGGENFRKCVEVGIRDIYYSGWTLVTGMLPKSYNASNIPEPEHVESEVIIDFKEGLRQLPSALYEPGDGRLDEPSFETRRHDSFLPEYRIWREPICEEYQSIRESLFSREDEIHRQIWQDIEKQDKFLTRNRDIAGIYFTDKHLAILPKRLPGYVLRERKFAILNARNVEIDLETGKAGLDIVQMPLGHKRIIKSAVAAHFQKRQRERSHRTTVRGVDLVRGKGNGLIILLHGPPGTGKTLTAEAVALEQKKPLFPITCGDLGFTPDKVEQSLKDIFRYAHLWDCILLLDEADVFLTRRNVTDIQRNALVSGMASCCPPPTRLCVC